MQSCVTGGVFLKMWTKVKPSNKMLVYKTRKMHGKA